MSQGTQDMAKESVSDDLETKASEEEETKSGEKREIPLEKMKKAELIENIHELKKKVEENYDLYVRSQAEIENLKRRFQKDKTDLAKFANETLIKQLLPVLDNLENAIAHADNADALEALTEGVKLTLKGLVDSLKKAGLEEVKALGQPFDPHYHQAVSEKVDDSVEPGTVVQELQKGYLLNERLLRPSMVLVSKAGS